MPQQLSESSNLPRLIIHTDGGARGNPGPAATGIVVLDSHGAVIHEFGRFLGETTNNVAEYSAVIDALRWFVHDSGLYPKPCTLFFKLDSNLVVQQLNRVFRIKEARLFDLAEKIWELINTNNLQVTFTYVPRSENWMADKQVNLTLDNI